MKTRILIRYGELSTKGRNKKMFTQKLASNLKKALVDFPQVKVIPDYDFMYLDLHEAPEEAVIEKVKPIFGIQSISSVYIIEKDMEIIREAIYKEVERGGQVFYVYNRVEFIENTVNDLKKELPNIEIDYAHGKMTPKQIEKKMKDFVENKTKVLVCTTILESGIDIPNANTIIIEDGDKLRTCTTISNER